jgi:starch-binding outer membrane protein, SusD/RagB family
MEMNTKNWLIIMLVLPAATCGCNKLVEVPPTPDELNSDNVYTNDATAAAVLTGLYTEISAGNMQLGVSIDAISLGCGLSCDEFTLDGGAANGNTQLVQFYQNDLSPGQSIAPASSIWSDLYSDIYIVNIALDRISLSTELSASVKQQLTGEAEFMRAFLYFYLVNLYGSAPLATSSDYTTNESLPRTPSTTVYQQIVTDLKNAKISLTAGYVAADAISSTTERVRPNRWSAGALLARAYLYSGDWADAAAESDSVIANSGLYSLDTLNGVFLKNSNEAIWQLQPVITGWNTDDAEVFIIPSTGPTANYSGAGYPVYLSPQLLSSFESGDLRRHNWVDSVIVNGVTYYFPYKYKSAKLNAPVTEYSMVFRLGEQYLIRAEAEANGAGGGISAGIADLNTIRHRAGLPSYSGAASENSLLAAILHERQVELFTEWGHRWLDLKRTGNIDAVMNQVAPTKGTTWNSDWQLYPLPLYDITLDQNLTQNPGY